jgi:CheY-like chemotaxis protein
MPADDALAVLVVNDEPEVLSFFAKLLDANGMRALLARSPDEAIGIASRGYIPIDLVLTEVSLQPDTATPGIRSGQELVDRIRELRPEVRVLYMSASLDSGMIRVELTSLQGTSKTSDSQGLIESIRTAAAAPLVLRMGNKYL